MRVIIAGSREIDIDINELDVILQNSKFDIKIVVSGGARGADSLGECWAKDNEIPYEVYPADWNKYGKSAGYKRNELMADNADALVAIWNGKSRGTKNMIDIARRRQLPVYIYKTDASRINDNEWDI